jgi:predicted ABC-type ATPase
MDPNISDSLFEMVPEPRGLKGNIMKTIIIIAAAAGKGKTTLCQFLCSDKIAYISMDTLVVKSSEWSTMTDVIGYVASLKNPSSYIFKINNFIDKLFSDKFIEELLEKFILKCDHTHFIIEGHFFTYQNNRTNFIEQCKKHGIRLWMCDAVV